MRLAHAIFFAPLFLVFTGPAWAQVGADQCNELLRLGYKNIEIRTSAYQRDYAESFDKEASQSSASNRSFGVGVSFMGYGGSADSHSGNQQSNSEVEKNRLMEHLRDNVSDTTIQLHDEAIKSWLECMRLAKEGLQIDSISPTPDLKGVTLQLRYLDKPYIMFNGVDITGTDEAEKDVACVVTPPTGNRLDLGPDTRFLLDPAATLISCNRTPQRIQDGREFFDPVRLAFKTEHGGIVVDMPPLTLVEVDQTELNRIYHKLVHLEQEILDVKSRLDEVYVSEWREVSGNGPQEIIFYHGLHGIPAEVEVQFSQDKSTVYQVIWKYTTNDLHGSDPVAVAADEQVVKLEFVGSSTPLYLFQYPRAGDLIFHHGYFRIVARVPPTPSSPMATEMNSTKNTAPSETHAN